MVFMRDNGGLELAVSNGDGAVPSFEGNMHSPWFCSVHPNCNPAAVEQILQSGELEFNRLAMQKGLLWMGNHPAPFARLTLLRAICFWCDYFPRRKIVSGPHGLLFTGGRRTIDNVGPGIQADGRSVRSNLDGLSADLLCHPVYGSLRGADSAGDPAPGGLRHLRLGRAEKEIGGGGGGRTFSGCGKQVTC